jgi:sulfotransferase
MIHFISGLPRSGSTLLCNVLAQNPRFHATATSGILDTLFSVRNHWQEQIEFKAMVPAERLAALRRVLHGMLTGYFGDVDKPVVFDKSRGWLAYIEMAENILDQPIKILVPVRDLRGVLASFEKIWRRNAPTQQMGQERDNYFRWQSVAGRCEVLMQIDQPVGLAYTRIQDALQRGFADRLHFVEYEQFCRNPKRTMLDVYEFLGEELFVHDFDNVQQVTQEDDGVQGLQDLHTIRAKIEPAVQDWAQVLGPAAQTYKGFELW